MDPSNILAIIQLIGSLSGNPEFGTPPEDRNISLASVGEVGEAVIKCYHPTGRFRAAQVVANRWQGASMYSAEKSAVVRVFWNGGLTGNGYTTDVALMQRGGMVRSYVIADNAMVPPKKNCWLESWTRPQ
ncbi:hypothetical protein [Magnetospirillum sp. 64-120]|uniref:hypothetical protein n=1 Tax=Magnetospirillum sp. 64-120 TaxID=1895778 RepID=UPI0009266B8F|nr:hypothetical protein [Magnetospirillum sp. 64-120]OJX65834.1 MAG: hypothetical protein BGO92_06990 [Magnetospirillum sp. 64-120]